MARSDGNVNIKKHSHSLSGSPSTHSAVPNNIEKSSEADVTKPADLAGAAEQAREAENNKKAVPATAKITTINMDDEDVVQMMSSMNDPIFAIRLHIMNGNDESGAEIADCFSDASVETPVTTTSLSELDVYGIINNPKLRYDVNFDRELHFRPNLDGARGCEKIRQNEEFWKALEGELFMYARVQIGLAEAKTAEDKEQWLKIRVASQRRLPPVLGVVRDVLAALAPEADRPAIRERLDITFVMQEIQSGVCDIVNLAEWLSVTIKCHCAPMRDIAVNNTCDEIKRGAMEGRCDILVNGIRKLLGMLETMKLDVANHQIRQMRSVLIEDTVDFLRRYSVHRISARKIEPAHSRGWVETEMISLAARGRESNHVAALTSAMLRGLLNNEHYTYRWPQTFYLDADRLRLISGNLRSDICQELIQDVFHEATKEVALRCKVPKHVMEQNAAVLRSRVAMIMGVGVRFTDRIENIAAEIMRVVVALEGRSPYTTDSALMSWLEDRLLEDLHLDSPAFENIAAATYERIIPKLQASVKQHIRMCANWLSELLVTPSPQSAARSGRGAMLSPAGVAQSTDPDDGPVRRLTHIIVLHWHIYAKLVYLAPPGSDDYYYSGSSSEDPNPPSSRSISPIPEPEEEAIYAPGREWIPVAVRVKEPASGRSGSTASSSDADDAPPSAGHEPSDNQTPDRSRLDSEQ